jgi:predicted AAA+ superfamily ATPase
MGVSLQAVDAERWNGLFDRVARVLELAERALAEAVGAPPEQALFDRFHAFRWEVRRERGRLVPIEQWHRFDLADLIGVERAVARLVANTEQFLVGHPANHVLLYGERGTGKSSAVKGLLTRYGDRGLRIVEVQKSDLLHLPDVVVALRDSPHRFLLFCDDLSFDLGEKSFRELKAALEGSLAAPPANVRIVATSNRRHLLPERVEDNREARLDEHGDLHMGETVDEKLALSDRFGLMIGFYPFDQATYLSIVEYYARKAGLPAENAQLREEALRWALQRASRSGRTAKQFVDDFAGRAALAEPERPSARRS